MTPQQEPSEIAPPKRRTDGGSGGTGGEPRSTGFRKAVAMSSLASEVSLADLVSPNAIPVAPPPSGRGKAPVAPRAASPAAASETPAHTAEGPRPPEPDAGKTGPVGPPPPVTGRKPIIIGAAVVATCALIALPFLLPGTSSHTGSDSATGAPAGGAAAAPGAQPTLDKLKPTSASGSQPASAGATNVLIRNGVNRMCASVPGSGPGAAGGQVVESACGAFGTVNQRWNVQSQADGKTFTIRSTHDNLCLDLASHAASPAGTPVSESPCGSPATDSQLWRLEDQGYNTVWIRNVASNGLCLGVTGNPSSAKDVQLALDTCDLTHDDRWYWLHNWS